MEELKRKIIEKIEKDGLSLDVNNFSSYLEKELKVLAKENGNDATFGAIIRKLIYG